MKKSYSLPKYLVQKFGRDKMREIVGLNPQPVNTAKTTRSDKTRRMIEWVDKTTLKRFSSAQAARYSGVGSGCVAGAILRGLPNVKVFSSYTDKSTGQNHSIVWERV